MNKTIIKTIFALICAALSFSASAGWTHSGDEVQASLDCAAALTVYATDPVYANSSYCDVYYTAGGGYKRFIWRLADPGTDAWTQEAFSFCDSPDDSFNTDTLVCEAALPTDSDCSVHTGKSAFIQMALSDSPPATVVLSDGCIADTPSLCISSGGGKQCIYKYNGTASTTQPTIPDTDITLNGSNPINCITSDVAGEVCYKSTGLNCGQFNGEEVCAGQTPASQCITAADGSQFCAEDAPAPTKTDGTTMQVDSSVTWNDGSVTKYYSNVTNNIGAAGSGDISAVTGSLDAIEQGLCGGSGQPKCQIEIDETGTPTGTDNMYDSVLSGTGLDGLSDGIAGGEIIPQTTINPYSMLPNYSACQTISIDVLGNAWVFPSASGCARLQQFKNITAWVFYVLTTITVFMIVMGANKKE